MLALEESLYGHSKAKPRTLEIGTGQVICSRCFRVNVRPRVFKLHRLRSNECNPFYEQSFSKNKALPAESNQQFPSRALRWACLPRRKPDWPATIIGNTTLPSSPSGSVPAEARLASNDHCLPASASSVATATAPTRCPNRTPLSAEPTSPCRFGICGPTPMAWSAACSMSPPPPSPPDLRQGRTRDLDRRRADTAGAARRAVAGDQLVGGGAVGCASRAAPAGARRVRHAIAARGGDGRAAEAGAIVSWLVRRPKRPGTVTARERHQALRRGVGRHHPIHVRQGLDAPRRRWPEELEDASIEVMAMHRRGRSHTFTRRGRRHPRQEAEPATLGNDGVLADSTHQTRALSGAEVRRNSGRRAWPPALRSTLAAATGKPRRCSWPHAGPGGAGKGARALADPRSLRDFRASQGGRRPGAHNGVLQGTIA